MHHMGRALARRGHAILLISLEYVRRFLTAHQNDDRDAEFTEAARAEASTRLLLTILGTERSIQARWWSQSAIDVLP
ncbi:hypothetical protein ABIC78_004096 [Novosphingobium sp. 1529]